MTPLTRGLCGLLLVHAACANAHERPSDAVAGQAALVAGANGAGNLGAARAGTSARDATQPDAATDALQAGSGPCIPSEERCDGIDNDCDGALDEGLASHCKTERCRGVACAAGSACDPADGRCVPAIACANASETTSRCEARKDSWWQPSPCDPQQCGRWQNGTCAAHCACGDGGVYRWSIACTE